MTAQEKWTTTIRYMELIRENYALLKGGEAYRIKGIQNRSQVQEMRKWLHAIERAYRTLRLRLNKSSARARRDWLVAHVIELAVFEGAQTDRIPSALNTPYPLNQRYMSSLMKEAVLAIQRTAEAEGLLNG